MPRTAEGKICLRQGYRVGREMAQAFHRRIVRSDGLLVYIEMEKNGAEELKETIFKICEIKKRINATIASTYFDYFIMAKKSVAIIFFREPQFMQQFYNRGRSTISYCTKYGTENEINDLLNSKTKSIYLLSVE